MSSFSCPNLDTAKTFCKRLKTDCVPGRKGCVLKSSKYVFAVPAEDRIKRIMNNKDSARNSG